MISVPSPPWTQSSSVVRAPKNNIFVDYSAVWLAAVKNCQRGSALTSLAHTDPPRGKAYSRAFVPTSFWILVRTRKFHEIQTASCWVLVKYVGRWAPRKKVSQFSRIMYCVFVSVVHKESVYICLRGNLRLFLSLQKLNLWGTHIENLLCWRSRGDFAPDLGICFFVSAFYRPSVSILQNNEMY